MKEINQESFNEFVTKVSDIIDDADYYQAIYNELLSKGRCIKGGDYDYIDAAKKLGKDPNFITNLLVCYVDWCNDYIKFLNDMKLLIKIFHKDEDGIKERDEFIKNQPVAKAAYTQGGDQQLAGMIGKMVPERDTIDQAMVTGSINNGDELQRITFGNSIMAPENYGSFATPVVPGLVKLPDGRLAVQNPELLTTYLASNILQPAGAPAPNMEQMVQQQQVGMSYVPQFITVQDGQEVAVPAMPTYQVPWQIDPNFVASENQNNKGNNKIPWCKYILDSGSVNNLHEEMKEKHEDLFQKVKQTAGRLLRARKFIEQVYTLTHMDTALFRFVNVIDDNNFVIAMVMCDSRTLEATYMNENVSFTIR